jgi:L-ribulokinase
MLAWYVGLLASSDAGYEQLEQEAAAIGPGETGLVALDWWNGNRSILADADLTGAILGLTLQTGRAEIYRALLEAIALGNRRIVDNFTEHELPVDEIVACGGIAERSPLLMQLFADTTGRPVHVPGSSEIPARGSALFGAVAGGAFADIGAAVAALRPGVARTYQPDSEAKLVFDEVYALYRSLYDTLGHSQVELLHGIKRIMRERRAA